MYDIRFALDGAVTCRVYQAGYMQTAYWDPGDPLFFIHMNCCILSDQLLWS